MFYLKLTNFKKWQNKEIKLMNRSLALLQGDSGSGKSSILEAINFALYGKNSSDIITYGKTKCSVELNIGDIKIIRSKPPNRLIYESPSGIFEEAVAQAEINKKFGNNFQITSYMIQKAIKTFLKLSPADKAIFLEQFIFSGVDISIFKHSVKKIIKERKNDFIKKDGQYEIMYKDFLELKEPNEIENPLGKMELDKFNKLYLDNKNEISRLQKEEIKLKELYVKFEQLLIKKENKLQSIKREEEMTNGKDEDELTQCVSETMVKISEIKSNINIIKEYEEMAKLKAKYSEDLKYFEELKMKESNERKDELNNLQMELKEIEKRIKREDTSLEELNKNKQEYQNLLKYNIDYTQFKNELEELISEDFNILIDKCSRLLIENKQLIKEKETFISDTRNKLDIQSCPHCSKDLQIHKGIIIKANSSPISKEDREKLSNYVSDIKKLKNESDKLEKDISGYKNNLHLINNLNKKLKDLSDKIGDRGNQDELKNDIKNIQDKINSMIENDNLKSKLETKIKQFDVNAMSSTLRDMKSKLIKDKSRIKNVQIPKFNITETSIERLNSELTEYTVKLKGCNDTLNTYKRNKSTLNSLRLELENIEKELISIGLNKEEFQTKLDKLSLDIFDLNKKEEKFNKLKKKMNVYLEWAKEKKIYNDRKEKVKGCKKESEISGNKLVASELLYKKILECESFVIMNVINTINNTASFYISKFFPDTSVVVKLKSRKEKGKVSKPELNIAINYQGVDTKLTSLSGGERDRIELAFMLSLNHLFNGELILLDECLSSLHEDLCNDILRFLKEQNKFIFVISHQVNSGIFDQVIDCTTE